MRKYPINLKIDVQNKALLNDVPSFFLQPIVENSVKHGELKENGEIVICAKIVNDSIAVTVKDNGVGVGDRIDSIKSNLSLRENNIHQQYKQESYGIGLKNIYTRMKILYGSAFMMNVRNGSDNGFIVTLTFPLEES